MCLQWEVASLCLGVVRKLLHEYDVQMDHFADHVLESSSGHAVVNKPAGFNILLQMLKDSRLFQMVPRYVSMVIQYRYASMVIQINSFFLSFFKI